MKFRILSRNENVKTTDIVQSIKKHADSSLKYTSLDSLELFRDIENRSLGECFTSINLFHALKDFYNIEILPEATELYLEKNVPDYTEQEEAEANAWLETLTEKEKTYIEIIRYTNPTYLVPTAN